jgi:hypothetical protein
MMDAINQPLLAIDDLSVAFHQPSGTSVAVDHISYEIKRGDHSSPRPAKCSRASGSAAITSAGSPRS